MPIITILGPKGQWAFYLFITIRYKFFRMISLIQFFVWKKYDWFKNPFSLNTFFINNSVFLFLSTEYNAYLSICLSSGITYQLIDYLSNLNIYLSLGEYSLQALTLLVQREDVLMELTDRYNLIFSIAPHIVIVLPT